MKVKIYFQTIKWKDGLLLNEIRTKLTETEGKKTI